MANKVKYNLGCNSAILITITFVSINRTRIWNYMLHSFRINHTGLGNGNLGNGKPC